MQVDRRMDLLGQIDQAIVELEQLGGTKNSLLVYCLSCILWLSCFESDGPLAVLARVLKGYREQVQIDYGRELEARGD